MKNKKLIIVIIVLLLAVIALLICLLLRPVGSNDNISKTSSRDPNAAVGQIEGKTQEEIQNELNKVVERGMFNISINPVPVFESGTAQGDLRIENIPSNIYLMSVEITLDETGEVVYSSGVIEPNYHIQTAALGKDLSAGTYPATAVFTAYDPDTEEIAGKAAATIIITVNN